MKFTKDTEITYEKLLLLFNSFLKQINSSIEENIQLFSKKVRKVYKFRGISYISRDKRDASFEILCQNMENNTVEKFDYFFYPTIYPSNLTKIAGRDNSNSRFCLNEIRQYNAIRQSFSNTFKLNGESFLAKLYPITNFDNSLENNYALIKIINERTGEMDEFHYYYNKRCIYKKIGNNVILLPDAMKDNILSKLPCYNYKKLPKILRDYIRQKKMQIDLETSLDVEGPKDNQNFMTLILNKVDCNTSSIDVKESIKKILYKLKETNYPSKNLTKIVITNEIFFELNNLDYKTIDPFFNDPDIIKYCDLSKIDFTNVDIRNVYLADTNARININKLYNRDITNANLENVNLITQELRDITADGANLRGTYVTVSVDSASIINTKFDTNSDFFIGGTKLSIDEVKALGLDVVDQQEREVNLKI